MTVQLPVKKLEHTVFLQICSSGTIYFAQLAMVQLPFQKELINDDPPKLNSRCYTLSNVTSLRMCRVQKVLHVGLVVVSNLLDSDVILGLDIGLCGGIGPGQSHYADDVLEFLLVLHFDLREGNRLVKRASSKWKKVWRQRPNPTGTSHPYNYLIMMGP